MAKAPVKRERDADWYKALPQNSNVQFVNYDLTPEDKVAFKKWAHEQAAEILTLIESVAETLYGVSVKWDIKAECFAAFVTCNKDGDQNKGWVLSGRGSSVFSAVMGVLYRHLVLFEGVWPIESTRKFSIDDD